MSSLNLKKTAVIALCLTLVMSGCGKMEKTQNDSRSPKTAESTSDESIADSPDESTDSSETSEPESKKKPAHMTIGSNGAKAVTDVLMVPEEDVDISRKVSFTDLYGIHALHSEVVGLVGAPIEVDFDKSEVKRGKLVFMYDPNELKGVRPDALMFMWYDEKNDNYVELDDGMLSTESCFMTIEIDKPGVYLLVNKYAWLNVWGAGLKDNGLEDGYNPYDEPISSEIWEKNEKTGDILKLKDDDYIASCREGDRYVFDVSTPEQLASAVYVSNCADPRPGITINILNDIDLEGYEWASLGWYTAGINYDFNGHIEGNGYTIKNMHISDGYNVGFIGYATNCSVLSLNFENATVGGSVVGILAGYPRNSLFHDCHVQGVTAGNRDVGSMIGHDQSNDIIDCTADVNVDGKQVSEYLSYTEMNIAEVSAAHKPTETIWIDDIGRPSRESGLEDKYDNIGWLVKRDGVEVLHRNAEGETSLPWQFYDELNIPGHYEVVLTACVDRSYIPISNTVEYDVP